MLCLCDTDPSSPSPIKSLSPGSAFFGDLWDGGSGIYEVKFKEVPVCEGKVGTRIVYQAEPELGRVK